MGFQRSHGKVRFGTPLVLIAVGLSGASCSLTITNAPKAPPGAAPPASTVRLAVPPAANVQAAQQPAQRAAQPAPARPAAALAAANVPPAQELPEETDEQVWKAVEAALGGPGALKSGVYTVTVPRDDLELTVNGNDVPSAAGIASEFRFYRCPCGRINVIGQFVVADYEANDVIDALREDPNVGIEVVSIAPFLLHEKPRLTLVRFFGENRSGGAMARTLRTALDWTGAKRAAPQKVE